MTCQGYSFISVSTPPTILVLLLTCPQPHVLLVVLVLKMMLVVVGVLEVWGSIVEEDAENWKLKNSIGAFFYLQLQFDFAFPFLSLSLLLHQLTNHFCRYIYWAANYCQKPMPSHIDIRAELESDVGAGAGEGARDGGAAVALGGEAVIDLDKVITTFKVTLNIKTVKCEGDGCSFIRLQIPSLK